VVPHQKLSRQEQNTVKINMYTYALGALPFIIIITRAWRRINRLGYKNINGKLKIPTTIHNALCGRTVNVEGRRMYTHIHIMYEMTN